MTHCSDDDLVLLHYGEEDRHAAHVATCAQCGERYRALASVLATMTVDTVPERGPQYGLEVWQRIRHRLPARDPWWRIVPPLQWALGATAAMVLIAAGFAAGRLWPTPPSPETARVERPTSHADDARRVLLLTVADHLERSERILTDIVNASGGGDISAEQAWAGDLVAASRLYRQEAIETNETSMAAVLDELERTLLEVVHRPSRVTNADIEDLRSRIDSAALMFKVRVLGSELRELTDPAATPSSQATQTIG
jgi:polyhydroxyalkanoate synthesis regulator phasin